MTQRSQPLESERAGNQARIEGELLPTQVQGKNSRDISEAKNPDLRGSLAAMQRAAKMARRIAIETNTAIVVVRDGKTVCIPAEQLRMEEE